MNQPDVIKIACPACGQHYSFTDATDPMDVVCQHCGAEFIVTNAPEGGNTARLAHPGTATKRVPSGQLHPLLSGLSVSRIVMLVLAAVAALGLIISAIFYLLNIGTGVNAPSYKDLKEEGFSGTPQPYHEVASRYDRDIKKLLIEEDLPTEARSWFLGVLSNLPAEHRSEFLRGCRSVMRDLRRAKDPGVTKTDAFEAYVAHFRVASDAALDVQRENKETREHARRAAFAFSVLLVLLVALFILLQIEENTRRR